MQSAQTTNMPSTMLVGQSVPKAKGSGPGIWYYRVKLVGFVHSDPRKGSSEGILALYCGGSIHADLRVCDSMLHMSTTEGLRDSYLFCRVNDAALPEAESITALA